MPTSSQRARQPQAQTPQPVDTMLLGSLSFNAERPGRCSSCGATTTTRRVLRVTYLPPQLNRREQDHLARGDERSSAEVADHYMQRVARRQMRGDLGTEKKMVICAACATRWLVDCLQNGPGVRDIPGTKASTAEAVYGARQMVAAALKHHKPLFVAITWRIERGPDGRSQVTAVTHPGGPIAPQLLIRAQPDMRRYARQLGRSLFS